MPEHEPARADGGTQRANTAVKLMDISRPEEVIALDPERPVSPFRPTDTNVRTLG